MVLHVYIDVRASDSVWLTDNAETIRSIVKDNSWGLETRSDQQLRITIKMEATSERLGAQRGFNLVDRAFSNFPQLHAEYSESENKQNKWDQYKNRYKVVEIDSRSKTGRRPKRLRTRVVEMEPFSKHDDEPTRVDRIAKRINSFADGSSGYVASKNIRVHPIKKERTKEELKDLEVADGISQRFQWLLMLSFLLVPTLSLLISKDWEQAFFFSWKAGLIYSLVGIFSTAIVVAIPARLLSRSEKAVISLIIVVLELYSFLFNWNFDLSSLNAALLFLIIVTGIFLVFILYGLVFVPNIPGAGKLIARLSLVAAPSLVAINFFTNLYWDSFFSNFGVPIYVAEIDYFSRGFIAFNVGLVFFAASAIFGGAIGWYSYLAEDDLFGGTVLIFALFYYAVGFTAATIGTGLAAYNAADTVVEDLRGKQLGPSSQVRYLGIEFDTLCLTPVGEKLDIHDGRLDLSSPVVTVRTTDGRLYAVNSRISEDWADLKIDDRQAPNISDSLVSSVQCVGNYN